VFAATDVRNETKRLHNGLTEDRVHTTIREHKRGKSGRHKEKSRISQIAAEKLLVALVVGLKGLAKKFETGLVVRVAAWVPEERT
jgi:hypothetical protein